MSATISSLNFRIMCLLMILIHEDWRLGARYWDWEIRPIIHHPPPCQLVSRSPCLRFTLPLHLFTLSPSHCVARLLGSSVLGDPHPCWPRWSWRRPLPASSCSSAHCS